VFPLNLYARVRFCYLNLHARPRVQRAPGLPCALGFSRVATKHNSGVSAPREFFCCPKFEWEIERGCDLPSHQARSAWWGRDERSSLLGVGGGGSINGFDIDVTRGATPDPRFAGEGSRLDIPHARG
jgi:hypothetical protein